MNCPVCKTTELTPNSLELSLESLECGGCSGNWLSGKAYWAWHETHGANLPERVGKDDEPDVADDRRAALCPECGHFMRGYRVGHDVPFSIDHCGHCFGTWFNRNEWDVLRSRNLHDDLHSLFSETYQASLVEAELAASRRRLWIDKLGEEDFGELVRIKRWIDGHPKRHELLAYLLNDA